VDKNELEKKIKKYHDKNTEGRIDIYSNVVVIGEIITSLLGEDRDCIALVLHDGDKLEHIIHLNVEAAIKLVAGISQILELDEEDYDDE
jgi:hypothetical protein